MTPTSAPPRDVLNASHEVPRPDLALLEDAQRLATRLHGTDVVWMNVGMAAARRGITSDQLESFARVQGLPQTAAAHALFDLGFAVRSVELALGDQAMIDWPPAVAEAAAKLNAALVLLRAALDGLGIAAAAR
jgi:hypothetical protein